MPKSSSQINDKFKNDADDSNLSVYELNRRAIIDKTRDLEAAVGMVLMEPLEREKEIYLQKSRELKEAGAGAAELISLETQSKKNMEEYTKVVDNYVETMSAEGGTVAEISQKMVKSEARVSKLALLFVHRNLFPKLFDAGKWALNMEGGPQQKHRKEAFKEITRHFKTNSQFKDLAWMVVRFMNPEDQLAFAKEYTKGFSPQQALSFMEEGLGAFSPNQIEEVLGGLKGGKAEVTTLLTDDRRAKQTSLYAAQRDFSRQAKERAKTSYGSTNDAVEMMTLKNGGLFLIQLASAGTILGNVVANAWSSGKFRVTNLKGALNESTAIAAGAFTMAHLAKDKEPLAEKFASAEERQSKEKKNAIAGLKVGIQNKEFTDLIEGNNFLMGEAMWEYRNYLRKNLGDDNGSLPEEKLTVSRGGKAERGTFLFWLNTQSTEKFKPLIGKISEMAEKNGEESVNRNFNRFMIAFDVYKVGGITLAKTYKEIIKQANS